MLLDLGQVSEELRVSYSMIRKLIRQGRLPVVKLGRRVLVTRAGLRAFIKHASRSASPLRSSSRGERQGNA